MVFLIVLLFACIASGEQPVATVPQPTATKTPLTWRSLEPGLSYTSGMSFSFRGYRNIELRVIRIDPAFFSFHLYNASASPAESAELLSPRTWAKRQQMVAAINPGMYQKDFRTSTGLMKTVNHVNNPRLGRDKTLLAFDRNDRDVPEVTIIDRECDDYQQLATKYRSLIQSIRMISCEGKNVWEQKPERWSTAAIASDTAGHILFIHVRTPMTTHDLIAFLQSLPLDLEKALYAEGGYEAQLYINAGTLEEHVSGVADSIVLKATQGSIDFPIPNILGVKRKATVKQ